jgi:FkbM family methyltransferase
VGTISNYIWRKLKKQIERTLSVKIYSNHAHGREDWFDIKKTGCDITTIFDVGANIGQSTAKFRGAFPGSTIFCFEPVEIAFNILSATMIKSERISLHKLALADTPGKKTIYLTSDLTTSSFLPSVTTTDTAIVPVSTVDDFMAEKAIDRIDLLKIDVEGYDLKVLEGAKESLHGRRIAFVIVEVGFNGKTSPHVQFEDVRVFLASHGYVVFGIYDQQVEWSGEPRLRYANVCFCNEEAVVKK